MNLTAIITVEAFSDGAPAYVAHCPELGVTSQGGTIEEAHAMLQEAVEGWLEIASAEEIERCLHEGGRAVALMALDVVAPEPALLAA